MSLESKHHLVFDNENPGGFINAHTHEMEEFGGMHPDFQIVLPLNPKMVSAILSNAVEWAMDRVEPIEENVFYDDIVLTPVKFVKRQESGREVLRMILPDQDGRFESSEFPLFAGQADADVRHLMADYGEEEGEGWRP
jgi:hypothetical protein